LADQRNAAIRKNLLFIISHDISLRFGCYGDRTAVTPHLDRLAGESVLFENHFCQYPLCAPSRANLFIGGRPNTLERYDIGDNHWYAGFRRRRPDVATLPEHFRRQGYLSLGLHKVYHEYEQDPPSWSREPWYAPMEPVPSWVPDDFECRERVSRYRRPENLALMKERFERLTAAEPEAATQFKRWRGGPVEEADVPDQAYPAGKVADRAVAELRGLASAGPFFLGVGFAVTHLPWLAPARYWRLYDDQDIRLPENDSPPRGVAEKYARLPNEVYQYYAQDYGRLDRSSRWRPSREEALRLTRGHYAAISFLDAQVGRILHALDETGLTDRTIVVFTTDHGFALGEHGHWGKHCLHEPDLRVPLMIRDPDHRPGRTAALTEHVDLYPTLCDLADLPRPGHWLEGTSALPQLADPRRPGKPAVLSQCRCGEDMGFSLRTARYRYTRWVGADGTAEHEELYDYHADPLETTSVAADGRYASPLAELRASLDRYMHP